MSIGMDGSVPDTLFLEERRRRLAAERTLDHTRRELARTHSALVANADRLSRQYLSERDQNLKMTERQQAVLQQRKEAAERADRARRRLWHALETMRDGFALFDMQGRLIAANHVYLDLFDAASELAPGCHVSEVFMLAADEGAFDIGDLRPAAWAQAQMAAFCNFRTGAHRTAMSCRWSSTSPNTGRARLRWPPPAMQPNRQRGPRLTFLPG